MVEGSGWSHRDAVDFDFGVGADGFDFRFISGARDNCVLLLDAVEGVEQKGRKQMITACTFWMLSKGSIDVKNVFFFHSTFIFLVAY